MVQGVEVRGVVSRTGLDGVLEKGKEKRKRRGEASVGPLHSHFDEGGQWRRRPIRALLCLHVGARFDHRREVHVSGADDGVCAILMRV